ncbi:MAG: hypothetical protein JXA66_02150 [Oligoflexia bacterium]|nr:hypothetical protein [Oligoflexia bacterium]
MIPGSFSKRDYSEVPVYEIDLSEPEISKFVPGRGSGYFDYFNRLSDRDKKIFVKLAATDLLKDEVKLDEPPIIIYKKDGLFKIETYVHIPISFDKALPVFKGFEKYREWVLKGMNIRRTDSKGHYFVDINDMEYIPAKKRFRTKVYLRVVFGGNYKLDLCVLDELDSSPVPVLTLQACRSSKLVKEMKGEYRSFVLPGASYFVVYFSGYARVHWALYNFLPMALVKSQVGERVETILENIQYKVEDVKEDPVNRKIKNN